jgi:hypothetical protein
MAKDISYHGYEDSNLTISYLNLGVSNITTTGTVIKVAFTRFVFTNDGYDQNLTNPQDFCLTMFTGGSLGSSGKTEDCAEVTLPILYPVMTVDSAVQMWAHRIITVTALFLAVVVLQ